MKRIIAAFLAMVLMFASVPVPPAGAAENIPAAAASRDEIQTVLTEAFNELKAKLNPGDGTYDGAFQLLSHALFGNGEDLLMGESDAFSGLVFHTNLMEEAFVPVLTRAFQHILGTGKARQIGYLSTDWYDNNSKWQSGIWKGDSLPDLRLLNNAETSSQYYGLMSGLGVTQTFAGPYNDYDAAMVLLVGAVNTWFTIEQVENNAGALTYRVQLKMMDLFNFDRSYDKMEGDAKLAKLLTWVGKLMEMGAVVKSFYFSVDLEFDVTFSNSCTHQTDTYRWEFDADDVTTVTESGYGVNTATKTRHEYVGAEGNLVQCYYYPLDWEIPLRHDSPWAIEYRAKGIGIYFGSEVLASDDCKSPYLVHRSMVYAGTGERFEIRDEQGIRRNRFKWSFYGVKLSDHQIKTNVIHTYRLQNVVNADGSNMVYLIVDGQTIAPLNQFYFQDETVKESVTVDMEQTVDWVNGKDFGVRYLFGKSYAKTPTMELEYIQIWENGIESPNKSLYYTQTKAPTCTGKGYTAHICARCGDTWADNYVDARDHSYGAWTSKDDTLHVRTCSACSEEVTDAHNWSGSTCTDCGCTKNTDITGTWETDVTLSAAELGVNTPDARLRCTLKFGSDGKVTASWQAVELSAFREFYHTLFVNAYYACAYGAGITSFEEVEAACQASNGMGVSEYIDSFLDSFDIHALFTPAPASGTYRADSAGIYTDLPIMGTPSDKTVPNPYTLEGNTLNWKAASYGQPTYTFVCTKK